MKIEIILPDTAMVGTMTYLDIDPENGHADLCNVVLNGLEDGNLYDTTKDGDEKPQTVVNQFGNNPVNISGSVCTFNL